MTPGVIYLARKAPSHGEANETNVEAQGDSNSLFPIGDQATSMWLMSRDHDVNAFMRGGNHELKDDRNRLMPRRATANYLLPTTVDGAFYVLVFDVPEYVKEDLRAAAGKENLYDEIKNAEGLYVHQFSCLQKTFVVVNTNFPRSSAFASWTFEFLAFVLGLILYMQGANFIRGFFDDFSHHKQGLTASLRVCFWVCTGLAVLSWKYKNCNETYAKEHQIRIDYGTFDNFA